MLRFLRSGDTHILFARYAFENRFVVLGVVPVK